MPNKHIEEKILKVLEKSWCTTAAVAQETGMTPGAAHRILEALQAAGQVIHRADLGHVEWGIPVPAIL